jgi:hypothetical protein
MRKLAYSLSFLLLILIVDSTAFATSWVMLEPEEVIDRSEVILIGKYNFSSDVTRSDFIFQGYEFEVKQVLKGDPVEQLVIGIDFNDTGWAEEFQDEGGEFLLFLETNENTDFLIPVVGPNGMIQLSNGEVVHPIVEKKKFFENFLKSQTVAEREEPIDQEEGAAISDRDENKHLYITGIVVISFVIGIVIYRRYIRKT